ncbi:MAG: hypothetical protein HFJ09_09750 [Lachnospiraceae bacterium]|nr:hypothetical protein [Lachnospiraceae bacterium]
MNNKEENTKTIKDFIYFDEDSITSYMAQMNDGKIETEFLGTTVSSTDTTENIAENDEETLEATLQGNIIALKGNIHLISKIIPASTNTYLSNTEIGKDYAVRKMHDNAYNRFEKYIQNRNVLFTSNNDAKIEDFILIKDQISIFDLDYISNIVGSEWLPELLLNDMNEAREQINTLKAQKGIENKKAQIKNISDNINKSEKELKKNIKLMQIAMSVLKDILPTDIVIVTKEFVIPVRKEFLREDSKMLMFKYDNQNVSILGKKLRKFSFSENTGIFSELYNELTQICLSTFDIELENKHIISPVVIYC